MAYTIFFCVTPILIVLSPFVIGLVIDIYRFHERNVRNAIHAERLRELAEKRTHRAMVAEAKIAAENDKAEKARLEIDLLNLKIQKSRKDLNLDAPDFKPQDYE